MLRKRKKGHGGEVTVHRWGILLITAYAGRLRPNEVPISGFGCIKGRGSLLLTEIYERVGKSVISVGEMTHKG